VLPSGQHLLGLAKDSSKGLNPVNFTATKIILIIDSMIVIQVLKRFADIHIGILAQRDMSHAYQTHSLPMNCLRV
jgi:hypothetical protein